VTLYHEPPTDGYSEAKLIILKMLWDGEWVLGDDVLEAVGQSYYDRRIRELRDEDGWDIESGWRENKEGVKRPAYRLRSHYRGQGIKRISISAAEKRLILEGDQYTCQVCEADQTDGQNNPQIDHKVPLLRGGPNLIANYQAICSNCNVIKRGICKKCGLPKCDNCYLAFPEKGANNILINLTQAESRHLTRVAEALRVTRIQALRKVVKDAFKRRSSPE